MTHDLSRMILALFRGSQGDVVRVHVERLISEDAAAGESARILQTMCLRDDNAKLRIATEPGAIARLVSMLKSGSAICQEEASGRGVGWIGR